MGTAGIVSKSSAVMAVGAYYLAAVPLSKFLSEDKMLWYWGFALINLALAAGLMVPGSKVLYIAATAMFISAMVTLATYYGWGAGDRMYGSISHFLMFFVVTSALVHAVRGVS